MDQIKEMVQLSGPIKILDMSPSESLDLAIRPSIKRQGSMENLKGFEKSRMEEDTESRTDFSDYDDLLIESRKFALNDPRSKKLKVAAEMPASDSETHVKTKAAIPKPTRARLVKPQKHEEEAEESVNKDHRELQRAHSELLNELRVINRENRDQSIELRDVKKQNSQIREAYNRLYTEMTEDPQRFNKRERNKYHEHFQMMEQHISYLQHELEKRDNHIEMLTKQTREANHEKDELDGANRRLQRQIKELSTNLTECKDDLLRLQPTSQTSDSEIAEQYSNLCQQIAGWVDDQTEDVEVLEERFDGMTSIEQLNLDPILTQYTSMDHLKIAQEYPNSIPLMLQHLIHSYVAHFVLASSVYFFGLDVHNVGLIQQIEKGMTLLEPRRDTVTLRKWRSEALHGLLKVDGFTALRTEQSEALAKSLYSALAHMLGGAGVEVSSEGWKELHEQVVHPAIDLGTAIRISMVDYHFATHLFRKSPEKANIIYHNEIQHYQLIDNATHKIIRPDSAIKIAEDGRIGSELLVVSPALIRQKDDNHKAIVSKPTIIVKLDQPMEKRNKGIKSLGSFMTSFLGGESAPE